MSFKTYNNYQINKIKKLDVAMIELGGYFQDLREKLI